MEKARVLATGVLAALAGRLGILAAPVLEIGRASCRERVSLAV